MRLFSYAALFALATGSLVARADPTAVSPHPDSWNQWWCQAHVEGLSRPVYFAGWSARFAPGSGQGQQAHQTAYQWALSHCNDYGNYYSAYCNCDFQNDCWVERYGPQ
jgi:hypothetical protein